MINNHHIQNNKGIWLATLILIVVSSLLISGCGAEEPRVYRVGILGGGLMVAISDGFKAKMTELGYVEGQNVVYDFPEDQADMQAVAEQFVADKVDLIFTAGSTPAALTAKAATQGTDVPVVFAYAGIEGNGLVDSVREPGGNITGVRYPGPETISKRLELLLEIAPQVKRVWIGYDKNSSNIAPTLEVLRPTASALGVTLVEVPATTPEELQADLAARNQLSDVGLDGIILMPDGFNYSSDGFAMISKFAGEHRIPLGASSLHMVEQGAVFGLSSDMIKVGELAAPLADKVLQGTPAGTIPVLTPNQDLYINYKVAQELGLNLDEGLLSQAAEIIR